MALIFILHSSYSVGKCWVPRRNEAYGERGGSGIYKTETSILFNIYEWQKEEYEWWYRIFPKFHKSIVDSRNNFFFFFKVSQTVIIELVISVSCPDLLLTSFLLSSLDLLLTSFLLSIIFEEKKKKTVTLVLLEKYCSYQV